MSTIVNCEWLHERLNDDPENMVVVDVRFYLNDAEAGRKAYLKDHIPNAVYLDLEKDLSDKPQKHGGKHPLPDMETFVAKLGNIGINNDTDVVIYDQSNDMFAARLWWLLDYVGHEKIFLLDGGYDEWVNQGYEVSDEIPTLTSSKKFIPDFQKYTVADIEEVKEKMETGAATLIDSRARARYLGKTEPLYIKAGHIPGAKNFFWKDVLDDRGKWKSPAELEDNFSALSKDDEIIVSCGSGVSACPNILALRTAGYKNVKLYPGSFSDWISYPENKVTKGEE
ncbi:sulfurtransferase [Virgibacillus kekensis]|uniref:Sulfurtransferase n=1 Tax=Virgibacillus kekensis TaxID=202261 RepID=A0ABV9DPD1_9BACI